MKMGRRTSEDLWWIKRKNHKLTNTHSFKERRKIQSRNECFRTCNQRNLISRTEITYNSESLNKIETIFIRYYKKIWSLDKL